MANTGVDSRKVLAELKRLRAKAPNLADRLTGQWAENIVSDIKFGAPLDTGRMRDSTAWQRVGRNFRIFCNTVYAAAVHAKQPWFAKVLADRALPTLKTTVDNIRAEFERSGGDVGTSSNGTTPEEAARRGEATYRKEMARRAKGKKK